MQNTNAKKLFIKTWGCQMNAYDSRKMADVLIPMGYKEVTEAEGADMIILNTCHIREKATEKVFSELGRLKKHKKQAEAEGRKMLMAVAGCVAQAEGDFIAERAPMSIWCLAHNHLEHYLKWWQRPQGHTARNASFTLNF